MCSAKMETEIQDLLNITMPEREEEPVSQLKIDEDCLLAKLNVAMDFGNLDEAMNEAYDLLKLSYTERTLKLWAMKYYLEHYADNGEYSNAFRRLVKLKKNRIRRRAENC